VEDTIKGKLLAEIIGSQAFQAQIALENETLSSCISKMQTMDLSDPNVLLEFAKARGAIEAIKSVQALRKRLADLSRSSTSTIS
jgi:hypothetical protein